MTQLESAREGIITKEMETAAREEGVSAEFIRSGIAEGTIVLPANIYHTSLHPYAIGKGLRTKMNVNLGISSDVCNYDTEQAKAKLAWEMGAEAIMDLSCYGETAPFREWLVKNSPASIGTVPMYDVKGVLHKGLKDMTADDLFSVVERHAKDGVDFMTIHAGLNRETAKHIMRNKRITNLVSRGGSVLFAWMYMHGKENPFYEQFDRLLLLLKKYDVTLSLGDGCRSGCGHDSTDAVQISELINLGELVVRARKAGVQVMVEGPGHVPLNQVAANMEIQKTICMGAPFYVLGPLVTDIAPGYDHITAAIGGAVAAMSGAAFLCYVTPAEHLALPNVDDVKQGIVASKIAAHAADIAKGIPHARDIDDKMGDARRVLDWDAQFACALDPETAKAIRDARLPEDDHSDTCSMCGKFCAVRSMNKALAGEYIDIL